MCTTYTKFTEEELDILLDFVKANDVLYDPKHKSHKKYRDRSVLWKQIAKKLNKNTHHCMRRWANIRDNYTRQKKSGNVALSAFARRRNEKLSFLENGRTEEKIKSNSPPSTTTYWEPGLYEVLEVKNEAIEDSSFDYEESADSTQSHEFVPEVVGVVDPLKVKCPEVSECSQSKISASPTLDFEENVKCTEISPKRIRINSVLDSINVKEIEVSQNQSRINPVEVNCLKNPESFRETVQPAKLSGLEHYFAGICETVAKFPRIQQARIKMDISALVGKTEIEVLMEEEKLKYLH